MLYLRADAAGGDMSCSVVLVLLVCAVNGFSLTDSSRLLKALSPFSSQKTRWLYRLQGFYLSLIIFICALGKLQCKVVSFFQTFLWYHHDLCSVSNANKLLNYYISCSEKSPVRKITERSTKVVVFISEGLLQQLQQGLEAVLRDQQRGAEKP